MKGFIKVLESVIASIMIISTMTFILSFQKPADSRSEQFDYMLAALQKNGTLNASIIGNDADFLNSALENALPSTVDFSVEVAGIPNPVIKILCACTDIDQSRLVARLADMEFGYKRRNMEIRVSNGEYDTLGDGFRNLGRLISSQPDADILFFYGYQDVSDSKALLQGFLQNGTLFMLGDLTQANVRDGVMDELFGLEWDDSVPSSTNADFADRNNAKSVSYRIFRYYAALGGQENDNFNGFSTNGNKIKLDGRTVAGPPPGNPVGSFVKTNEIGRGRTVWFADYDSSGQQGAAINRLLKASVLWASGEHFSMDPRFKIVPASQPFRRYSYVGVLDGSEPFLVTLKIWNVFY